MIWITLSDFYSIKKYKIKLIGQWTIVQIKKFDFADDYTENDFANICWILSFGLNFDLKTKVFFLF